MNNKTREKLNALTGRVKDEPLECLEEITEIVSDLIDVVFIERSANEFHYDIHWINRIVGAIAFSIREGLEN